MAVSLGTAADTDPERLGHTTITTTADIYSHVTPTMQQEAVDRFAAAVNGTD